MTIQASPPLSLADWQQAARAAEAAQDWPQAMAAWREVLWLRQDDIEAAYALSAILVQQGDMKKAIETTQSMLRRWPHHPLLQQQLAEHWLELAEWDKAAAVLALCTPNAEIEALQQRLEQERRGHMQPARYARHLFNDYAPQFEQALAKLGYAAPALIAAAIKPWLEGKTALNLIDLGCGTGLMAPYLAPYAQTLVGVDIAEKMLALAQERQLYTQLLHDDMVAALAPPKQWDGVIAADAVVYVGDLAPLVQAVALRLKPQGFFAFSCEVNDVPPDDFMLQESRRFAHGRAYLEQLCAQYALRITHYEPAILRHDRGAAIRGAIVIMSHQS